MSMIEQLREETRHQAPVAPPKEPSADAESPHPSNKAARAVAPDPTHPDICRYWIAQLEAIQALPAEQQAVRLKDALAKAPEAYRPTPDEAGVLQAASQTLSINSVLGWLHLRPELPTEVSPLSPTAAQHWRQHLPASSDPHWAAHQIRRHPALRTYWAQVEQAVQQAGGDPAPLWRTLDNPTTDNARTLLALLQGHLNQALNRAPSLATDFEGVRQAFGRLNQRWEKSVTDSRKAGQPWFPSDDQVQRLKAACLDAPPNNARLLTSAERLVRRLQEIYRAAMEGLRAGVSTRAPAPGP
ncbi:MAG: hypothetical protein H6969_12300 [Gammaproteobacteria bacterium]|nr:hypothetical protein [Gammaproteobacteria bacterium]